MTKTEARNIIIKCAKLHFLLNRKNKTAQWTEQKYLVPCFTGAKRLTR